MRYHIEKPKIYTCMYGEIYHCNHLLYNTCTLFLIGNNGIAVIQQRFDDVSKTTYWTHIDEWLVDLIYLRPNFFDYFKKRSGVCENGLYKTVTIRQLMWALKIKPLKKQRWETVFDRKYI